MMKTLAVVSGKGGTGKTSIVASFAAIENSAVFADCDVDASNLHLMLHPEIKKKNPFSGAKVASIDPESCFSCGICQAVCRFDAIHEMTEGMSVSFAIDPVACEGCGVCEWNCPEKAIQMVDEPSGEWYISDTDYGPLVHARLGIGAENSGRLVTIVRNFARGIGEARDKEFMIIDGSPGVGCPVIASLTGVDFALVTTEPTLSGEHDMKRIAELTAHFDIPTRICINKWDLNPDISDRIEKWGEETGHTVIGKIRFDKSISESIRRGIPAVEAGSPEVSEEIRTLWTRVKEELSKKDTTTSKEVNHAGI